jgi:transposase
MIIDHVKKTLDNLELEISSVENELEKLIRDDKDMKDKFDKLIEYVGVKEKTATRLLANFPELGTVGKREITAIAGLAPHARDSGKKKGYRSTGGGRIVTKEILFFPAGTAIQHNKELKAFRNRLISKGKTKMKAIVAVMRKMLVQLNAILRKELKRKEEEKAATTVVA